MNLSDDLLFAFESRRVFHRTETDDDSLVAFAVSAFPVTGLARVFVWCREALLFTCCSNLDEVNELNLLDIFLYRAVPGILLLYRIAIGAITRLHIVSLNIN